MVFATTFHNLSLSESGSAYPHKALPFWGSREIERVMSLSD